MLELHRLKPRFELGLAHYLNQSHSLIATIK